MPRFHVAIGVSVAHAADFTDDVERALRETATNKYVCAIGACGLDASAPASAIPPLDVQREVLERQIAIARELDLSLVVESTGAYNELLDVVKQSGIEPDRVLVRAFGGDSDELASWVEWGAFVSFDVAAADDPVTYCKLARMVPGNRILVESGAPQRTPAQLAGYPPRTDQVVFVADALLGVVPASQLALNAQLFYRR